MGWLNILNCALPSIGVIVILDYWKNREKFRGEYRECAVNWFNIAGIVVGAVAANLLPWGIAAVNAMVVAALCFLLGELVRREK